MSQPPDLPGLAAAAADAERRLDWPEVAALHETMRTLFPDHEPAWLGGVRALSEQRRHDELDSVLSTARQRFPHSLPIAAQHAASAARRGDTDEAVRRGRAVAEAFPDHPAAQLDLCAMLNAARRFDETDAHAAPLLQRFPDHLPLQVEHARAAEGRRDWAASLARWQALDARFPGRAMIPLGMALALRELRRLDEADAVLDRALPAHPANRQLLEASALIAQVRRDWPQAIARWDAVLRHVPSSPAALMGRILALRESKRLGEAAEALALAREHLPASAALLSEQARLAAARGEPDAAIDLWTTLHKDAPDSPQPLVEIAGLLLRQQRYDAADALLAPRLDRFAGHADILAAYAQVAGRRRDWPEAIRRWRLAEARHPDDVHVLGGLAEALWGQKDEQALVPVLDRLLARQPDSVTGAILYARLEMRRNQAAAAVARLTAAEARHPGHPHLVATLGDARMQALVSANPPPPSTRTAATRHQAAPISDNLFTRFESLGSGCEFGLLQRRFGAEPLGLLRWGTISPAGLIDMLESRFDRIGDLAHTSIRPVGDNYELADSHYRMSMQTFIATSTEAAETLLPKLCNRMKYLARELTESMEEADRILTYKIADPMTGQQIDRLWKAVSGYGDNALLLVRLADAEHPAGSTDVIQDGLMIGYLDRFSNKDISVDAWTQICTAASEAWTQAQSHRQVMASLDAWN